VCQAETEQKSAWVLKAPEAELTDATGKQIVHHFAGLAWKHIDGSEVRGKVVAKQDAAKPDAIPWLLLSAASHTGEGTLARITTIQRIHTEGGLPPKASVCNVSANGKESRSAGLLFLGACSAVRIVIPPISRAGVELKRRPIKRIVESAATKQ
jgi:hypothetical protein